MSKGGVGGWVPQGQFRRADPEPGGGETKVRGGQEVVNMRGF